MSETVLLKSGDLYFDTSNGGSNVPLPVGRKLWLNEQIIDMCDNIMALQSQVGKDGKDGRDVVMRVGIFPEGAADIPENYAIMWRWQPRPGDIETSWQILMRYTDLKGQKGDDGAVGPEGPQGPAGAQGTGIAFKGSVVHSTELALLPMAQVGDGYLETSTGCLWVLMGQPWGIPTNWHNMGKISGPKGDKGDRGPQGKKGEKGDDGQAGSLSMFVVQWMVNTATSAAMSSVMIEVSTMVNDAINDAINQLMGQMENMVEQAVENTIEGMMDELKGDKGEKGDKGDAGKDGKSVRMVGRYDTLTEFTVRYPATKDNVGVATLIGKDGEEKSLWAITETPAFGGLPAHYSYEELGDIRGPQGEAASWTVSIRDKAFTQKGDELEVVSDLPSGVAGMYIQETDSILVEGIKGSQEDAKQVGFKMSMKYPIPKLVKEGEHGIPTKGKVLGNDGEKLAWVEGGSGSGNTEEEILLKGADGRIWSLNIDDDGRLHQDLSIETTDKIVLKIKSPNGQNWGITIDNSGKLNISEVV